MSTSMGTAVLAEQKSVFADYYRWEEPNRDITYLNLETANRLQAEVFGSDGSPHDAGIEIGGILLGRRERQGERIITFIEDFDLLPCEHRSGPFYSLSASDLREFQTALSSRRSNPNQGNSVLGYYRSHKRKDLYLSRDDLALLRTLFPEPDSIILVIKALPGKVCTAGFFVWDNGRIQPEFTDSEFPLIPMERADFVPDPEALASESAGTEEVEPTPSLRYGRSETTGGSRWVIGGFAFITIAGAAIFAVLANHGNWNYLQSERPKPVVAAKASASPRVTQDETKTEQPPLGQTSQITRIAPPNARRTEGENRPERLVVAGLSRGRTEQPVVPETGSATRERVDNEQENAAVGRRPDGSSALPVQAATALPGTLLETAPPPVIAAPPAVEKDQAVPPVQQRAIPPGPAIPAPLEQAAPKPQLVETSFTGPQIIHQVAPAIPLGVGPRITTNIQIDVTVTIGENGKVIGARVSSTSGAAAGLLALQALKAAQLFRFRPAQENNRPVRSDMVLTFRFAPSTP